MKAKRILAIILIVLAMLLSACAKKATSDSGKVDLVTIFGDSNRQGKFGYFILVFFLIGLIYGGIRARQLFYSEKVNAANLYKGLKGYLKNNQITEAITIAEQLKHTTLGYIFFSGLSVFKEVRETTRKEDLGKAAKDAFEEAVLQRVYKLDAGLFWFDTLAQICTYLGLLGTIWGLLYAFTSLSEFAAASKDKNQMLTDGIRTAIGTTALGLLAAIPLTLIKGALFTKAQTRINEIDEYVVKMINYIDITTKG